MFRSLSIFFILVSSLGSAQTTYFKSIGGGFDGQPLNFAIDSTNNKFYTFGSFTKVKLTNLPVKFAAVWNGVKWDSIRHIVGDSIDQIVSIDHVLYGIGYQLKRENPATHIWEIIARPNTNGYFWRIAKYNNDLVIFGNIDSINGIKVSQIVKYDGTNFISLGNTNFSGNFFMQEYQGDLYIGGAFTESNYGLDNLAKWNGTTWIDIPWTSGCSFCGVGKMTVYQNKLFIGGRFSKAGGQAGDNLLSWDGTNLIDYGLVATTNETVWDMFIYKNKLIITGLTNANVPLSNQQFTGFLSYDGTNMCSYVPHYNNTSIFRLGQGGVFQDTLVFLSSRNMSPTDTVNYITKYVGDFIPLFCSTGVGIRETVKAQPIEIYPNPATSIVNIIDEQNQLQNSTIQIKNTLGQTVLSIPFQKEMDVSQLSSGIYFLQIKMEDKRVMNVKFIKE